MKMSDLSPELQSKVRACDTPEEIFALVRDEGMELSDEDMEKVSGGKEWYQMNIVCPICGSDDWTLLTNIGPYHCNQCHAEFN